MGKGKQPKVYDSSTYHGPEKPNPPKAKDGDWLSGFKGTQLNASDPETGAPIKIAASAVKPKPSPFAPGAIVCGCPKCKKAAAMVKAAKQAGQYAAPPKHENCKSTMTSYGDGPQKQHIPYDSSLEEKWFADELNLLKKGTFQIIDPPFEGLVNLTSGPAQMQAAIEEASKLLATVGQEAGKTTIVLEQIKKLLSDAISLHSMPPLIIAPNPDADGNFSIDIEAGDLGHMGAASGHWSAKFPVVQAFLKKLESEPPVTLPGGEASEYESKYHFKMPFENAAKDAKIAAYKKLFKFSLMYGVGSSKVKELIAHSPLSLDELIKAEPAFEATAAVQSDPIADAMLHSDKPLNYKKDFDTVCKTIVETVGLFKIETEADFAKQQFMAYLEIDPGPGQKKWAQNFGFVYGIPTKDVAILLLSAMQETLANEGIQMALQLKSFNGLSTISKLGVPQELFDWFKGHGGKASWVDGGIKLSINSETGTVPITLAHVQGLNLGTVPTYLKQNYRLKATAVLLALKKDWEGQGFSSVMTTEQVADKAAAKDFLDQYGLPKTGLAPGFPPVQPAPGVIGEYKPAPKPHYAKPLKPVDLAFPQGHEGNYYDKVAKPAAPVVVTGKDWELFELNALNSAPLIPLASATRLYQPVQGTTANKRYYVLAINKDLRIAAAYKGNELSARVEGPGLESKIGQLQSVFPNATQGKGYASLHIEVGTDLMAAKVVGALLMAVGEAWETPLPNLNVIKGQ